VSIRFTHLPYSKTGYFSKLVLDYLEKDEKLAGYYSFYPDDKGIGEAINQRNNFPVDRQLLQATLLKQYSSYKLHPTVKRNLQLLQEENTYTICTAHQPNLMTGYLYFVYKIIHAIKLAEELNFQYPDKNFVPVYYMGSEDNDLEELGTFRYGGKKYIWDAEGQAGAVGRMNTRSLKGIINELFKVLGPPGVSANHIKDVITQAYLKHNTITEATFYLVNELFGEYGLVILNPDEAAFKKTFLLVMKDDLLHQTAYPIVSKQIEAINVNYTAQAHPRLINLFYLNDIVRERIEHTDGEWHVVNTTIRWNIEQLLQELEMHPERFSPNVILRGLFQETILPNVAFIGGGAEVAYWLQLKPLFEHYNVYYPTILLRQSVLWIDSRNAKAREQLEYSIEEIFKPEAELIRQYVTKESDDDWHTTVEAKGIELLLQDLKQKAAIIDPTLRSSAEAVITKIKHQLNILEKKMYRAEKRKMHVQLNKITKLKQQLFPNGSLQERTDNFLEYYTEYGQTFFDEIKKNIQPLKAEFLVIEEYSNE
jgi:bacillithiol biosynthesis cysteine-adding enzyme BshC